MKTMRPFGRFVRPRAERCLRPGFHGLSPASDCCAFGHGQRTISARAYVSLHDGQVLQAHGRERSARTPRRCLRVSACARAIGWRAFITARYVDLPKAKSCLRDSQLIRASRSATRRGSLPPSDRSRARWR